MKKTKEIKSIQDLNQQDKWMKYGFYILIGLIIISIGFITYNHFNHQNEKAVQTQTKYINYLNSEAVASERIDDVKELFKRNDYKIFKQFTIGVSKDVNDDDKNYNIATTSGDQYTKVIYYKIDSNNYFRVTYFVNTNEMSSVKVIHKDKINPWLEFDKLQNVYAQTIKENGNINNSYKNNIINIINKNSYLYN